MSLDSSHQAGQTVGTKLRAARLARKYTQGRLAQPDFSVSYISAIERGQIQPSIRALEILAKRLDLSTSELLPRPDQLDIELSQALGNTSISNEERELQLLEAQIALYQGHATTALNLLQALYTQKGKREQDVITCHLLGRAYLENGYIQESEQVLAEAAKLAREVGDARYAHILHLQGLVYMAMHNAAQALQLQRESLILLEQEPVATRDIFLLARVYNSLGQHHSYLGQFDIALEMFQQALKALPEPTAYQQLKTTYEGLAHIQHEKADALLETLSDYKWLIVNFRASLPLLRSEIQHTLGRAILKNQPEDAHTYLLSVSEEASQFQDPLSQASAKIHLASWFLSQNQIKEAEQYVAEANKLASPFSTTIIGADVLFLQGEIAYAQLQNGEAYFERGLAILENTNAKEALVEQLTRYASLLEQNGSIAKAILYWKRAYELWPQN